MEALNHGLALNSILAMVMMVIPFVILNGII
jgi:hypothetical protein